MCGQIRLGYVAKGLVTRVFVENSKKRLEYKNLCKIFIKYIKLKKWTKIVVYNNVNTDIVSVNGIKLSLLKIY